MGKLRTELDALLDRLREDKLDPSGKNRNAIVYDCWRMFESLAERVKNDEAAPKLPNWVIPSAKALLELDARKALVPHGIGNAAREIITQFLAIHGGIK